MKKILFCVLALSTTPVFAAPYIGVAYGYGHANLDHNIQFNEQPSTQLDPSLNDGIFSAFAGYSFTPSWALEMGYRQYDLDDNHTAYLGVVSKDGKNYNHSKEWEASSDAKQFYLAPVWHYQINEKWRGMIKAGLTYSQYKNKQSLDDELELVTNDDIELNTRLEHQSATHNHWGALVGVGVEYQVMPQLFVGGDAQYQMDNFAQLASVQVSARYQF